MILGQQGGDLFNASGYVPAIYVGTDGKLHVEMFWTGGISQIVTTEPVWDAVYHHLAVTFDSTNETAYLDGQPIGNLPWSQSGYASTYAYELGVGDCGGWPSINGGRAYFSGQIDAPALYNRALAATEVAAIYAAGSAGKCTTIPFVSAAMPANGATQVASNSTISATFTESMNSASLNTNTFLIQDFNNNFLAGAVSYTDSNRTAVFTPAQPLAANSGYLATITTGAEATNGSFLPGSYSWHFSTLGNSVFIFSNTSIGAADTNYDGKDLVIANCIVTISGGTHTFSSIFVSHQGSLVLSGGTIQGSPITTTGGTSFIV